MNRQSAYLAFGDYFSPGYKNQIYRVGSGDTLKAFRVMRGTSKNVNYSSGVPNPTGLSLNGGASIMCFQ